MKTRRQTLTESNFLMLFHVKNMENTYIRRFQDPWIAITIRCIDGEMDKTYQKIKCTYFRISALNRWLAVIKIVVFRYFPLKIMLFIMQNTYIFRL